MPQILEILSRHLFYPLWDLRDGSTRLQECRRLMASQWWTKAEIRELQLRRLRETVKYAFTHCEYYRKSWSTLPSIGSPVDMAQIPLLSKQTVRDHFAELCSDEYAPQSLIMTKTGGSTGRALELCFDGRCQEWRNAAALRSDGWAGWRPGMLVAALWGTPPVPRTIKERIRNILHDRLFFLDTMRLDGHSMGEFAKELLRRRPGGLFGHAHSLFVFARFLEEQRIKVPRMQAIIATSMMLLDVERDVITRVFDCTVTNRYGCEEVGLIACQCGKDSGLHVNAEHVYVEILRPDGAPAVPGEEGQIVVTDLINKGMPLIRYAIEDMAIWSNRTCECGRQLPLIERIVGRVADFLKHRNGGLVAGVSLVEKTLTAIQGLDQLQIVQTSLARFELNIVATSNFTFSAEQELVGVLRNVFGADIDIVLNRLERIPQERNSKYRFSICQV